MANRTRSALRSLLLFIAWIGLSCRSALIFSTCGSLTRVRQKMTPTINKNLIAPKIGLTSPRNAAATPKCHSVLPPVVLGGSAAFRPNHFEPDHRVRHHQYRAAQPGLCGVLHG